MNNEEPFEVMTDLRADDDTFFRLPRFSLMQGIAYSLYIAHANQFPYERGVALVLELIPKGEYGPGKRKLKKCGYSGPF